jgi:leucyl aminopeptidase
MLDSANYYFNLEKQFAISENDDDFLIIVNGNIGENLYRKGNFKAALPLLVADANYSLSKNWFGNASNALIYISACYLELDKPAKSEQFMWKAYRFAKKDKELRRMKPIYKQFARWYAYKGDANKTLLYSDSLQYVHNQLHIKFDEFYGFEADKLVRLNASELELLQKQQEQELTKKVVWILVISSIFIIITTLLLFVNFRSRKLLKEKSLALSNSQLKGELEDATTKLNVYLKETQQKSLTEKVILTDADWREFLQFFNKVYPSFFASIKQKYPKLSKAELRFCCLSYLSLSDKEMSAMLGVGRASIRVTRGRTRAKLQLTATDSLEELLSLI